MTRINKPGERKIETALSLGILGTVYVVLGSRFDLDLLFSPTILTGGDSASWYQVLRTLATDFLPHGRLFGYSQANFFGYLEGQHYFPLPFLAAAALGAVFPLTVALKLATVAGGFALPACLFASAFSVTGRSRSGAIAASLGLLFLFNESYSIFGGNWLSTFAGEFCFSWAIAFLPLVASSCLRDIKEPRRRGVATGLFLGFTGLCHSFVFMPAFFLPFFPVFGIAARMLGKKRGHGGRLPSPSRAAQEKAIVARVLTTYCTAFAVMAFWLMPMIATRGWAQPISMIWRFPTTFAFASQTLAWLWAPAGVILIALSIFCDSAKGKIAGFFLYALFSCAFLFIIAPGLGMPDIRFVPSALVLLCLALPIVGEWGLEKMDRKIPASALTLIFACAACAVAVLSARNAPAWFRWNYSGYEAKAEWNALRELSERYSGDIGSGRILWEKQDQRDNKDFGSERGFENLYLFTGRPSAEGIHYGSSFMARATTYLQSSYSPNPVDPEPERIYSILDPDSWPARFDLLNAKYFIAHSTEITGRFASHPDFTVDSVIGKFTVFRYRGPASASGYVKVLEPEDLSVVDPGPGGFRVSYYRFFRDWELYGHPFVSTAFADARFEETKRYSNYDEYKASASAITNAPTSVRDEHMDNFSIRFTTDRPGKPHIIAASYAPGWKSSGGEKIYPVSPGFMLIFPETELVELRYGRSVWEVAGMLCSAAGLAAVALLSRRQKLPNLPARPLAAAGLAVFALAALFLLVQAGAGYPALAADIAAARRADLSGEAGRSIAAAKTARWANAANLDRYDNLLVFDAYRIRAALAAAEGRLAEAREIVALLKNRYPHTRVAEALPAY